jgi:hypothetical protein
MLMHQQILNKFFENKIEIDLTYCVETLKKKDINNRKIFQENHGAGKVFALQMGNNRLFQESFQKNPPEVTPSLYMESNRHCVEKLCAKEQK